MLKPRMRLKLWHHSAAVAISAPILAFGVRSPAGAMAIAIVFQWLALPLWAARSILRHEARHSGDDPPPYDPASYLLLGAGYYVAFLVLYFLPSVAALMLLAAFLIGDLGP